MYSLTYICRSFFILTALSSFGCVKKSVQNYTITKTEIEPHNAISAEFMEESHTFLNSEFSGEPEEKPYWEEGRTSMRHGEFVAYLPNIETLNETEALAITSVGSTLYLNGLKQLSPGVVEVLKKGGAGKIQLNGLKQLDPKTAKVFSDIGYSTDLGLNGLSEITPELAQELVRFPAGTIELKGVKQISDETVDILSQIPKNNRKKFPIIEMPNLELTPNVAKKIPLSTFSSIVRSRVQVDEMFVSMLLERDLDVLYFSSMKNIAPHLLSKIANKGCKALYIDSLDALSLSQAQSLSSFQGELLVLDGVKHIDASTIEALGSVVEISLNGVEDIDEETARALARVVQTSLYLNGVSSLSKEVVGIFSESNISSMSFEGLKSTKYRRLNNLNKHENRMVVFQ